jgi:hypothetical protein
MEALEELGINEGAKTNRTGHLIFQFLECFFSHSAQRLLLQLGKSELALALYTRLVSWVFTLVSRAGVTCTEFLH